MLLTTTRLVLRELRVEDEADLARYQRDPRYLEHQAEVPDAGMIVRAAMSWAEQSPRQNYQLAIAWSEQSPAIGCIGLRCLGQPPGNAEFGCELDPALWGRGIAHEAASALLAFGFGDLHLASVVASTAPENRRVHALLMKLRFAADDDAHRVFWRRARASQPD